MNKQYKHILVLTGAGVSAESGLATFRDAEGLWNNHKVEDVATIDAFERNPEYVHAFYNEMKPELSAAKPNPAHLALAKLENEYTGKTQHILTLKKIAEEIGFKAPFFTMTAWPSGIPDRNLLPMMGGYPDAPWTHGKTALKPNNRFAISCAKTENEIIYGTSIYFMDTAYVDRSYSINAENSIKEMKVLTDIRVEAVDTIGESVNYNFE